MDVILWLNIVLVVLVVVIIGLAAAYFLIVYRNKQLKEERQEIKDSQKNVGTFNGITKEEINKLLEFDEIKDDMIIRKNNEQFVMIIQCKGINYDLLSEEEKMSVEAGFVQFLNTLRFPIQLYVQTRSVNLKNILEEYQAKVDTISDSIRKLEEQRKEAVRIGNVEREERLAFEIRRKQNVLEYGQDMASYVGRMSLNKNVLQQKTYVVLSYFANEAGNISNYSKEEVRNICFSELYTRCQSVIRSLGTAQVFGRVLDSEEIAELLYIAYNRDDSELYQLSKALDAQYDALYSTGKDVLQKKQEKIEEEIEIQAMDLATDSILIADKKRKEEKDLKEKVKSKALEIIEEYKDKMEPDLYEKTKQEIKNQGKQRKDTKENKEIVEEKATKTSKRGPKAKKVSG
ncbi:MAG TPA: hypothetical protein IAB70_04035 [Candidatus Merdicola faecigallinarum]|uniref:TraC-like domain-containing protein n=1 Tax=Candidatus Merdicola faecigallinarum TaxID=2840862 RepID=A0A9D1M1G5_9FIRM|nr:hypothetical protein [Candidatus Merdicola faecigallinarum]